MGRTQGEGHVDNEEEGYNEVDYYSEGDEGDEDEGDGGIPSKVVDWSTRVHVWRIFEEDKSVPCTSPSAEEFQALNAILKHNYRHNLVDMGHHGGYLELVSRAFPLHLMHLDLNDPVSWSPACNTEGEQRFRDDEEQSAFDECFQKQSDEHWGRHRLLRMKQWAHLRTKGLSEAERYAYLGTYADGCLAMIDLKSTTWEELPVSAKVASGGSRSPDSSLLHTLVGPSVVPPTFARDFEALFTNHIYVKFFPAYDIARTKELSLGYRQ
jgi:hypothetical protein